MRLGSNTRRDKPQVLADPQSATISLRLVVYMIKNSVRKKQKLQEKREKMREAARFFAALTQIVVVADDGTERILKGNEAVEAIIRQWEAEERD